jgi:hypothetical protein
MPHILIIKLLLFVLRLTISQETRRGPNGKNTLCNACGLRWKKIEAEASSIRERMKIARLILDENAN